MSRINTSKTEKILEKRVSQKPKALNKNTEID